MGTALIGLMILGVFALSGFAGGGGSDLPDVDTYGEGDDSTRGSGGDDLIDAGSGDDFVYGADGADRYQGDAGADLFVDGAGNDTYLGGAGDDQFEILSGDNRVSGGAGNDQISSDTCGDGGVMTAEGGEGADTIVSFSGADTITGGSFGAHEDNAADVIRVPSGATVYLGADDRVEGGSVFLVNAQLDGVVTITSWDQGAGLLIVQYEGAVGPAYTALPNDADGSVTVSFGAGSVLLDGPFDASNISLERI